jgi:NitT/TauT family transport system substrate-binding protein
MKTAFLKTTGKLMGWNSPKPNRSQSREFTADRLDGPKPRMPLILLLATTLGVLGSPVVDAGHKISIGVLAFGTVNWELAAIVNEGLDKKYDLDLKVQTLAGPDAGKIGLHAGSLDMIVTDWIWVANQDQQGADFRFIPYSTHAGALMAPAASKIRSVADLSGKKLGIVGGGLDKNWLLLRALAKQKYQLDLDQSVEKVFGAPPLLNQQLVNGKLDALLNYWHYATKLEAQGFKRVMDGEDILKGLGFSQSIPNLGYVFKKSWASANNQGLVAFLEASEQARAMLCQSDEAWKKVLPLTQEKEPKTQSALRKEYCKGVVGRWSDTERQALARIYAILRETGGDNFTGKSPQLPMEIFWPHDFGENESNP